MSASSSLCRVSGLAVHWLAADPRGGVGLAVELREAELNVHRRDHPLAVGRAEPAARRGLDCPGLLRPCVLLVEVQEVRRVRLGEAQRTRHLLAVAVAALSPPPPPFHRALLGPFRNYHLRQHEGRGRGIRIVAGRMAGLAPAAPSSPAVPTSRRPTNGPQQVSQTAPPDHAAWTATWQSSDPGCPRPSVGSSW